MSYRGIFAISATLAVIGGPSYAAGQFGADSDVAGLTLSMTQTQAKQFVAKNYPGAPVIMLPATLIMPGYKLDATAGFAFEAKASRSNAPLFAQQDVDRTKILFNPKAASSDIFAISRHVNFGPDNNLTITTLRDSLLEKYGRPIDMKEWGVLKSDVDFIWAGSASSYNPRICAPDTHVYHPYFYEDIYLDRPLSRSVDETSRGLASFLSGHGNPKATMRGNCGVVLAVSVRRGLGARSDYVTEMRETLVDLTKGVAELTSFRNDFIARANQIKNEGIARDSLNKPKL